MVMTETTSRRAPLRTLFMIPLLLWALVVPSLAAPADWGESDWYKYIEMTVTVTMDKVHGGMKVPGWMKSTKPVGGRLPLLDVYAALSAAGSSVRPGLTAWLNNKMLEANEANDLHRLNVYQAYKSALNGHPGPLRRLREKAQAALDKAEEEKASQSLFLNDVLAKASTSRQVEVVAQFTVGGNSDKSLGSVTANAQVQGPKTSLTRVAQLSLSQPSGYQANQFYVALPKDSPGGRYSVDLFLSDSRGLRSEKKRAFFDIRVPDPEPKPDPEPEPEDISDPGKTPVVEKTPEPSKSPEPDTEPTKEPEPLGVQVVAPSETPVGRVVHLAARVNDGTPPYTYSWATDGKRWATESVTLDYDTPGQKTVYLKVEDSRGVEGRGTAQIQVSDGIAVNIAGPREISQGQSVTFKPLVVTGPTSGFEFSWATEGQQGTGESFSATYQTPGRKELICLAKHPSHPLYQTRAYITVLEAGEEAASLSARIAGPTRVEQGQVVTFTPEIQGGQAPFQYNWSVKGKSVSKKSIKGSFDSQGEQLVVLTVTDSQGTRVQTSLALRVAAVDSNSKTGRMVIGIQGPDKVAVGTAVSFSPSLKGGVGPYRFVWRVKGRRVEKKTVRGKFDSPGAKTVELSVFDSSKWSEQPVVVSKTVTVGGEQTSDDGAPVTFDEFVGRYDAIDEKSYDGSPFQYPIVFRADGVTGQDRGGRELNNDARWSIVNGILTVQKTDGSAYWNFRRTGRLTRRGNSFYWEFTSDKFTHVGKTLYRPTNR
jgi:hypothetical protein